MIHEGDRERMKALRDSDVIVADLILRDPAGVPVIREEDLLEKPGGHLKIAASIYDLSVHTRKDYLLVSPVCKRSLLIHGNGNGAGLLLMGEAPGTSGLSTRKGT